MGQTKIRDKKLWGQENNAGATAMDKVKDNLHPDTSNEFSHISSCNYHFLLSIKQKPEIF